MGTQDRLSQLHLIPDESQVSGGECRPHNVGQRKLAGFVNEQIVELAGQFRSAENPRCPSDNNRTGAERRDDFRTLNLFGKCRR